MWVPAHDPAAQVRTLVLAILRREERHVPVKEVVRLVGAFRDKVSDGSIANIGTQLHKAGLIERLPEGWRLLRTDAAPTVSGDYLWGPDSVFGNTETAWYRRAVIHRLLLDVLPDGLQIMQVVTHLGGMRWLRVPKDKGVIQDDIEVMESGPNPLVKRIGNTRKIKALPKQDESGRR